MGAEPVPGPLVEGRDYTVDAMGRWVFTRSYLLRRGRCCGSGCRNCPYGPPSKPVAADVESPPEPG
jgi:hypothetical protein